MQRDLQTSDIMAVRPRRHALNIFERFAETALKATTVSGTLVGKGPVPPA
jgi:hypothetical protein